MTTLAPTVPVAAKAPAPTPAAPPTADAAEPSPEARRAEAATLTASALNHFVQNNYGKARKAAEKALALDPSDKKAKELMKILGTLG